MHLILTIEMFGNPSSEYYVSEEFLNDMVLDSSGESEYWHFEQSGLNELISSIRRLFVVSNGGFTFQALDSTTKYSATKNLAIEEFVLLLSTQQINKHTKYIVIGSV